MLSCATFIIDKFVDSHVTNKYTTDWCKCTVYIKLSVT